MSVYTVNNVSLHINANYEESLGEEQVTKTIELLKRVNFPTNEVGIVCLDHVIQKQGLLLLVALFNTQDEPVEERSAEIHLHNGERQVVASGLISEGGLPIMQSGEAYFWHFFLPHEAFLVADVKLGEYYVEVIGKDENDTESEERTYSFYHIFASDKEVEEQDNRARVTLMNIPIEHTSELSLEAITKKKS